MLDFARRPAELSSKRFGAGAVVSIGAHVALIALITALSASGRARRELGVEVAFVDRPTAPEPAKVEPEPPPEEPAPPDADPDEPPPMAASPGWASPGPVTEGDEPAPGEDTYEALYEPSYVEGAPTGPGSGGTQKSPRVSTPAGAPTGTGRTVVHQPKGPVPFTPDMTAPKLISGQAPVYTRQALEAHVEGTMIVQCIINTAGTVGGCRVLQSVPFMEEAVLSALRTRRYSPVTKNGKPIDVAYVFRVHLVMPP
jgi:protein TonB